MQRSSPSIYTLASALAKAQGELVNPAKSLVATIRRAGPKGTEQTFRYAPLFSQSPLRKISRFFTICCVTARSSDCRSAMLTLP
jgi:hypothetical protein